MNTPQSPASQSSPERPAYLPTDPPPPSVSKKDRPKFANSAHRQASASAFEQGAEDYHAIRPGYPSAVLELLDLDGGTILDVGCGTGKLTEALVGEGHEVYALDPSMDMVRVLRSYLDVPAWCATAEATGAQESRFSVVTCAQTWHWVDTVAASAELDRITTDDAQVLLVWNTLDVSIPWVHRLSRIMHSGDTLKAGFVPDVAAPWAISQTLRLTWNQEMTPQQLHELTHTRSYWLRSNEKTRAKVTANLDWYLYEHLGLKADQVIELPYRLDAFVLTKQQ